MVPLSQGVILTASSGGLCPSSKEKKKRYILQQKGNIISVTISANLGAGLYSPKALCTLRYLSFKLQQKYVNCRESN